VSRDYISDASEDAAFSLRSIADRLDEIHEVLERIARVLEGPTAEERLAADYQRSKDTLLREQFELPRPLEDARGPIVERPEVDPDRIVSFEPGPC